MRDHALGQRLGEVAWLGAHRILIPELFEPSRRAMMDVPLKEDLECKFSGLVPKAHGRFLRRVRPEVLEGRLFRRCPGRGSTGSPRTVSNLFIRFAISMAALPASAPLLHRSPAAAPPDRASACSSVSVVRIPTMTGPP